jgi:hypothetical protein
MDGPRRDGDPRGKERVRDDREPAGIMDRSDRVSNDELGRHRSIDTQSQQMALPRRDFLTPHELGAPAAEQVAQSVECVDRVVVRDDCDIERRGGQGRDPIGEGEIPPEPIAGGMEVDVDAPGAIQVR